MEYPKFKYLKNSESCLKHNEEGVTCDCCGKMTNIFADAMYTSENINAICVECIKSGEAAEKFDGEFNTAVDIGNDEAYEELVKKTPQLFTYQEIDWPSCCDDYCTYLRACTDEDMENEELMQELEETFDEDEYDFEEIQEMSPDYLLLYKCEVCGKHIIKVDAD